MKLNRREFIAGIGIGLAVTPLFAAQSKPRVIVAGAGLSGLSAAYELSQMGYKVTVLEGRDRIGGRIFTLKKPFLNEQYVELGGELMGDGYKRMTGYAKKLGVPFEEFQEEFETGGAVTNLQGGIGTTAILKGQLYPIGSILEPHPYELKGDEAKMLPPALLSRYLRSISREIGNDPNKLLEFDKFSLAEVLRKNGASETAIKLMNIALNYNSIETVSAGGVLFEMQRRMSAGNHANKILGGNFELIKAMATNAKKSGVNLVLEAKIKQIKHSANSVKVSFVNKKGETQTLEAEKLVCTIPFSVLREIKFSPALPDAKAKVINEIAYTKITKVMMQGSRFEWDRRNLGSSIWTDTPLERIFSMSGQRGDKRGIWTAWMDGENASQPEKMSDQQRQVWAKKQFVEILPFMKDSIERTATKSWTSDEFSRGAFAHFLKGQFAEFKPNLKTQVGAIYFAGEHTAEFAPGMEGALESAERVVAEITKKNP